MRRGLRSALAAGMLGLAAVLLAAGLAAGQTPVAASPPAGVRTVHITIHFSSFDPERIDAVPGETVRFVIENTDPIDHEFILGDDAVQQIHELGTEAAELPDAAISPDNSLRVRVRLPDDTRAEVVFVKLSNKKGRTTRWLWTPDSAVLIEE
jgi:uncharacterized cupredoxin-like copper-binding protein